MNVRDWELLEGAVRADRSRARQPPDVTVRARIKRLVTSDDVDRCPYGPGVAYRALVGPAIAPDVADRTDGRRETSHDESEDTETPSSIAGVLLHHDGEAALQLHQPRID